MNQPIQPTLPMLRDWTEPQTVRFCELAAIIAEGRAAGFRAWAMDVLKGHYRVHFQRRPAADAPDKWPTLSGRLAHPLKSSADARRQYGAQNTPAAADAVAAMVEHSRNHQRPATRIKQIKDDNKIA